MSKEDRVVDYNPQITLSKVPTEKYPAHEEIFQLKYIPPIPTDQVKQGEVVVKNIYLSIDAAMRVWISGVKTYMDPVKPGDLMVGAGVGQVIYSNDPKFKTGDTVLGLTRWQRYSVLPAKELTPLPKGQKNYHNFLGVLGISGLTAYFGLKKIGNLKAGETVLVSAAAGAVGQIVIQLAKNEGCRVVAIAGSKDKCDYTKSIGADEAIDYKNENLKERLRKCCPKGVNVYFDNVGGEMLDQVLMHIRDFSRIIACGSISSYNTGTANRYKLKNYPRIIIKRAIIQGFIYFDYKSEIPQAIAELSQLMAQGKLKTKVDIYNGLDEAPKALKDLLTGHNTGKVIVKVDKDGVKPKL